MADVKYSYGAHVAATITIASLANGSSRQGVEVINSSNVLDYAVQLKIRTGASGALGHGVVNLWAYASIDDGTTRAEGATGLDAAFTIVTPTNLRMVGTLTANANNTTFISGAWSLAQAFGGMVPERFGFVLQNRSGTTLSATASDHSLQYQPVFVTVV